MNIAFLTLHKRTKNYAQLLGCKIAFDLDGDGCSFSIFQILF